MMATAGRFMSGFSNFSTKPICGLVIREKSRVVLMTKALTKANLSRARKRGKLLSRKTPTGYQGNHFSPSLLLPQTTTVYVSVMSEKIDEEGTKETPFPSGLGSEPESATDLYLHFLYIYTFFE